MDPPFEMVSVLGATTSDAYVEFATNSSESAASADPQPMVEVKPYQNYLPVAKRGKLAEREFELQMAQRELALREVEKSIQRYTAPKLKTYTIPFTLNDKQLKMATTRYPRTIFKCSIDAPHDHPLAHLETMIASDAAVRLIPAGHKVFDIYGNPKKCAALNRAQARSNNPKQFIPYVAIKTEKDHIRALDWDDHDYVLSRGGDEVEPSGLIRDFCWGGTPHPDKRLSLVNGKGVTFLAVHTLYYMSEREICSLLNLSGSRMIAVIHRHAGDKGSMFAGETTYGKHGGVVEQVNVATGERYVHKDLSYLFESRSKVVYSQFGAYTWTLHKQTDETWIVVLTGVYSYNERFVARSKDVGEAAAAEEVNTEDVMPSNFAHPALAHLPDASCVMVGGVPVVKAAGGAISGPVECPELVEYLRIHLSGKPRDATRLLDAYALARTHIQDGSDFAGKRNFVLPASSITRHVGLAFLSDLVAEVEVLRAVATYHAWTREHRSLSDGVHLVRPDTAPGVAGMAVRAAQIANASRKTGDTFDAILSVLH